MTGDLTPERQAAVDLLMADRRAKGLPETITDVTVLAKVAALMNHPRDRKPKTDVA